jgi:DNA-3-methyladenine glycosylase
VLLQKPPTALPRAFLEREVVQVARDLVGARLLVEGVGGTVVETEAYDREDPASHSHRGRTTRNAAMFGPAGHAHVYRSYGLHWCLNLVCGAEPLGSAVLVRAVEPTAGLERMRARRGTDDVRRLCAGPGRLCQALGMGGVYDGLALDGPPFRLEARSAPVAVAVAVAVGPRIGLTRGVDTPWRFRLAGSSFLSRPFAS